MILHVDVRQRGKNGYNLASEGRFEDCPGEGLLTWTLGPMFSSRPFHPGPAVVQAFGELRHDGSTFTQRTETKEIKITRR